MPPRISDEEKQRRKEGALAVLRDARDDQFQAVKDLEAHIGRELDITAGSARNLLSAVLNALPQGHALRQKRQGEVQEEGSRLERPVPQSR